VKGRPRPFRGWRVVAGSFLVLTLGFGAAYSCPAFADALADEFGASRGGLSMVLAVSTGTAFLVSAVGGPLADRVGARRVAMAGMALIGLGLALASVAASFERLLLCYGGLVGLGLGLAYVPAIAAVQRWFTRRRGLASGLALSGIGLGTALVPVVAELPARLGGDWRDALLVCGALVALGGMGGAALLAGPPPDRRVPGPDGEAAAVPATEGVALRDALGSRDFALLYGGTLLVSAPIALPFAHLVASAQDTGLPRGEALALVGLVGLGSLPGRVVMGLLADRLGRRAVFLFCCAGVAAATLFWAAAAERHAFGLFAAAFGVLYGGFVALLPAFTTDLFGRRAAAGTIGVLYTSRGLGVLAATPAFALGAAASGGYATPLVAAAGLGLLGTGVLATVGTGNRSGRRRRAAWSAAAAAERARAVAPYRAFVDIVWWTKP
jgi:MFS family permease